jgi:biopolymer transport protein ExbD
VIGSAGFTRRRSRRSRVMAEINITPFTDVVLVLLIIFMVSASFLGVDRQGLSVNLPAATASEAVPQQDVTVTVRADSSVFLGRDRIALRDLPGALQTRARARPIAMVVIQADERVRYDRIVKVMDAVKLAGLEKIALATDKK